MAGWAYLVRPDKEVVTEAIVNEDGLDPGTGACLAHVTGDGSAEVLVVSSTASSRGGAMGKTLRTVTNDDVNDAFEDGSYLSEDDDRLLAYLDVLCSTRIRNDANRLLANNRCITLNAVLTKRFVERSNRTTTFLAKVVVVLTGLAVLVGGAQLFFLFAGTSG